jgi:hypothetical protein
MTLISTQRPLKKRATQRIAETLCATPKLCISVLKNIKQL